jgi:hypothetical protein
MSKQRVMVMKTNNEVETDKEEKEEKIPPLEDADDVCVKYLVEGEVLMVRRTLNIHIKVDDLEGQKANIFHTRCYVQNKLCSLIIDGGSCNNLLSIKLVKKLQLHTAKHLIPYKL